MKTLIILFCLGTFLPPCFAQGNPMETFADSLDDPVRAPCSHQGHLAKVIMRERQGGYSQDEVRGRHKDADAVVTRAWKRRKPTTQEDVIDFEVREAFNCLRGGKK